jgi:hypothetical protein
MIGFCWVDVKPAGPVQEYVAPPLVDAVSSMSCPSQIGEFVLTVGTGGAVFTATVNVPTGLVQPFTVTVRLYIPALPVVADEITGF